MKNRLITKKFQKNKKRILKNVGWARWFAWFPIKVEGKLVWFKFVRRRPHDLVDLISEGLPKEPWKSNYKYQRDF